MTVRELYEWACSNHMEDAAIVIADRHGNAWPAEIESGNMDEVTLS